MNWLEQEVLAMKLCAMGLAAVVWVAFTGGYPRLQAADCNGNGVDDATDITGGVSQDCNNNGIPDDCDLRPGELTLRRRRPYLTTSRDQPFHVDGADFDGDADFDLAVGYLDTPPNVVSIYLNQGRGVGVMEWAQNYDIGGLPLALKAADLNGDGKADLAVLTAASEHSVSVLLNNGDGTFKAAVKYDLGGDPACRAMSLVAADIDGDSYYDLATGDYICNYLTVLLNRGDGTFGPPTNLDARPVVSAFLMAADLNGDGQVDLADVNGNPGVQDGDMVVFLNAGNGTGTFSDPQIHKWMCCNNGSGTCCNLKVQVGADLDADGYFDLAAPGGILFNNGDATFKDPALYDAGSEPRNVIASDLDGDGDKDLVNSHRGGLTVLRNSGGRTFSTPVSFPVGAFLGSLVAGDVDGDGDPDIAVTDYAAGTFEGIHIIYSGPSSDCDANRIPDECQVDDCNSNGIPDTCDIQAGLESDCNGNGVPDRCDLFIIGDCNGNDVPDDCDIAAGSSADSNQDGIPDECTPFLRGDANANGTVDLSDSIFTLGCLFLGTPCTSCADAADTNDNGAVDLSDAIFALGCLFLGTACPPEPFEGCGQDPTQDALDCGSFGPCAL